MTVVGSSPIGHSWVFDLLCKLLKGAEYVHVAHARSIRAIASSQHKNDHNDAWWLAYLAYEGHLPEVYIPTGVVRELRLATRERMALVQERTRTMKRIRAHLRQAGKGRTLRAGSIRTVKSHLALLQFAEEVEGGREIAVKQALAHIDAINLQVAGWEQRMEELSADLPAVQTLRSCIPVRAGGPCTPGGWTRARAVSARSDPDTRAPQVHQSRRPEAGFHPPSRATDDESMSTIQVVGCGSLLSEASARRSAPSLQNFRVVRVAGYMRIFNKVSRV